MIDRPLLDEHLEPIWSAFLDLSSDRMITFGSVGEIPFGAIDRYAIRYGIDDADEFERLRGLIRAMDREWRTLTAPKKGGR